MGDNMSRVQCGIDMFAKSLDLITTVLNILTETRESSYFTTDLFSVSNSQ